MLLYIRIAECVDFADFWTSKSYMDSDLESDRESSRSVVWFMEVMHDS